MNIVNPDNNIYPVNTYYKTNGFNEKYKHAMMKILLDTYKETNGTVYISESIRKRSIEYLTFTDWTLNWFNENYKLAETITDKYVSISDVFTELKLSDIYTSLTRNEKRGFTKQSLINKFKQNEIYSQYYQSEYRKQIDGRRIQTTNVLIGLVCDTYEIIEFNNS